MTRRIEATSIDQIRETVDAVLFRQGEVRIDGREDGTLVIWIEDEGDGSDEPLLFSDSDLRGSLEETPDDTDSKIGAMWAAAVKEKYLNDTQ
ncbi:MAG: hypothetical protein V5A52_07670 [Halovenus sp.]